MPLKLKKGYVVLLQKNVKGHFFVVLVTKLCLTVFNPMDYSLPGSSVHGIFQARVLEWGAIAFSLRV